MTGTRKTQQERVAESSRRLLEAAIELVAEQGYERTTATEISERAGYSPPMVRTRYGSKQGLMDSILHSVYDPWLFPPADEEEHDGLTRIDAQLSRLERVGEEQPELMRFFLVLSFECVTAARELKPWIESFLARYTGSLATMLRHGQVDGSVVGSIDADVEAQSIVSDGIGLAYISLITSDNADFVARMRRRREALTQRLRAATPAHRPIPRRTQR